MSLLSKMALGAAFAFMLTLAPSISMNDGGAWAQTKKAAPNCACMNRCQGSSSSICAACKKRCAKSY